MKYDVIIVGAGPGGVFAAYELMQLNSNLKVGVFESGHSLEKRRCPIDGKKIKSCIKCPTCSIMSGFGGAGAFSDGKYNITNDFGGSLYQYIGKKTALDLMNYVDKINMKYGGEGTKDITNSNAGEGLIFYGSTIVPFKDDFPKDTMLYRYMTTKPEETLQN